MVAGARSDYSDHDAAVTSRNSVTTRTVATATRARDVDAKRSIAKRQDDCSTSNMLNWLPISSSHPRPEAVVCDAAARCASRPPPGLRPFPQSFNTNARHQSSSRYPPTDCTAKPVDTVFPSCAYQTLLDGVLQLVDVEHIVDVLEIFADYQLALDRTLCQMQDRSHAEKLASQAEARVLRAEMMVLEEHHHQPACDDPHERFARPGTVEMLCCKAMAALDRHSHGERHSRRGGGTSSFGFGREPAYGRCPLTGRDMPREFTTAELEEISTDPEPAIPAEPDFRAKKCGVLSIPCCLPVHERKHYLQMHYARVADIRRAHNAGRLLRRDGRIAAIIASAVRQDRVAVTSAAATAQASAAHPPVSHGGAATRGSEVPLSWAVSQDMHVVLCRLHAAGSPIDVHLVRRLREIHRIRFDVHAHYERKASYAGLNLCEPVHAHASFVDGVIAEERATRARRRGRRSPTGRPNVGSMAARASKRAKNVHVACCRPTA